MRLNLKSDKPKVLRTKSIDIYSFINEVVNPEVDRIELIDHRNPPRETHGRVYTVNKCKVTLSYQDGGKTLKIFIDEKSK